MSYGGYAPYPRRFGGGRPRLQIIHDALNAAMGTAFDASNSDTVAWVETMAYARALCFDGYGTNDRAALQWDPDRMTDTLGRWERILRLNPAPGATSYDRRQAVKKKFKRFLEAASLHSSALGVLTRDLPGVFSAIEYIGVINAVVHVPDDTYPWGTVDSTYSWYSTVAKILVLLDKPEGYSEGDFYAAAARVFPILDGLMPGWVTFDWYRAPASGAPISVEEGPSQAGFYLDNDHNLDNSIFADSEGNPETYALTGWWRAPYTGSPWVGRASEGTSGSNDATEASNPPTATETLNSFTTANFDGVNDALKADGALGDYFDRFAFGGAILFKADTAANAPDEATPYNEECLTAAFSGNHFGVSVSTGGIRVWMLNGASTYLSVLLPCTTEEWHVIQYRYDGQRLWARLDSGDWSATDAAPLGAGAVTAELRFGRSPTSFQWFDGQKAEEMTMNTCPSFARCDLIKTYLNHRYVLDL